MITEINTIFGLSLLVLVEYADSGCTDCGAICRLAKKSILLLEEKNSLIPFFLIP